MTEPAALMPDHNIWLLLLLAAALTAGVLAAWLWHKQQRLRQALRESAVLRQSLQLQTDHLQALLDRENALRRELLAEAEQRYGRLKQECDTLREEKESATMAKLEADKQVALARQQLTAQEKRLEDWERQKEESINAARASILKAGGELSSKLLEDHKRELESAKKTTGEITQKTTEHLTRHFTTVTESVAALNAQMGQQKQTVNTMLRALSSPGEAGHFAEIGLENTLHGFGLEPERDFILQFSASGSDGAGLRPDAIVFLPDDTVLVIDCKASKFLLELAEVEGTEQEAAVLERLKKTMSQHVTALTRKEYAQAVASEVKKSGRRQRVRQTFSILYVPGDTALAKIKSADPDLARRAQRTGITLAGPSVLAGILAFASMKISIEKQAENQEHINDGIRSLLDGIVVIADHAAGASRGMRAASRAFDRFVKSTNRTLLPRARKLVQLGIEPSRHKTLPTHIDTVHPDDAVIDAVVQTAEETNTAAATLPAEKKALTAADDAEMA